MFDYIGSRRQKGKERSGVEPLPHDVNLIATIAVGFVLASIFGYLADRLHLPTLVG